MPTIRPDITLRRDSGSHEYLFQAHSARGNDFLARVFAGEEADLSWTACKAIVASASNCGLVVNIEGLDHYGQPLVNRLPW